MEEMMISVDQLKSILKKNKECEAWATACNEVFPKYEINTPARMAGFIAQCAHESLDFTVITENLNYGAKGLLSIFKKYFPSADLAAKYERQPEKIANRVYASRMGNGDEASGDGWKFRGKGLIQLTGKANHEAFAKSIGKTLDETLEYLTTKEGALESACWFWKTNGLNKFADTDDILGMTKRINGGTIGLEDRKKHYIHAKAVLAGNAPVVAHDDDDDAPVPTKVNGTEMIRRGSRGDLAKKVQEALGVDADGIFGPGSERALKAWQAENGLAADGIAGPATLKKLLG
jgi:putative chitinase